VKNIDVLLVNPPSTEKAPSVPHEVGEPIGLCYLAATLRDRGVVVEILDGFTLGLSVIQLVEITQNVLPRVLVGISVLETNALASASYVRELRASGFQGHLCAGNYYATLNPERLMRLAPGLDTIIRGEAEEPLAQLVEHLLRGDDGYQKLQGVCYAKGGDLVNNGIAPQENLDNILEPVRDCLDQTLDAGGTANLVTGRGCYANCSFCSIVVFTGAAGKRYRVRDEASVVEEMSKVIDQFGIRRILIPDDNFMLPSHQRAPRIQRLCDSITSREIDVEFTITCRVNDIHDDLVELLKASGLVGVYLGIESFLTRRLRYFNKGVKPEQNFNAFEILDKHDIFVKIGFIMYDPFITVDELIEELQILRDRVTSPAVIHTSIDNLIRHSTYPLELQAGTPIQKKMSALGRAFEVGAGFDYFFDYPECYALMRFAGSLLRFEGPTFAPLRALSYRLLFGESIGICHVEVDRECTRLWKDFGNAHFEIYLEVVRRLGKEEERRPEVFVELLEDYASTLNQLRDQALALIHDSGIGDLERPWIRFVDFDKEVDLGSVYDPETSTWLELGKAERYALKLWSRCKPDVVSAMLKERFGDNTAVRTMETIKGLIQSGHFVATREVTEPINLAKFSNILRDILSDLETGRVGPREVDFIDVSCERSDQ